MAMRDQGWNLDEVVKSMGLSLNKDVVFPQNFSPNKGFPVEVLNKIYNASDVVVSSTTGEGWGLAQVEAMATKTPVISPDNTACSEIIGEDRGILIDSGADIEHFVVIPHDNEVLRPIVSVQGMIDAFERLYSDEALRMTLGDNGHDWLHNNLIWSEHIRPLWESVIDEAVESLFSSQDDEECYDGAVEV
jgi:glycosyltransferase involved in cell wall biosynthesis